jgi:hypothetical protein
MYRRFVPFALMIVGGCFSSCAALAGSPPAKQQAPELRLHVAGRQTVGEAKGFSLAVEVSNPGTQMLRYLGYRPDSFAPPIPKGQMMPIYRIELKQAGKWQQHPIMWDCLTGMDELAFAPKASATFGVWVPAEPWEAVRIGVAWRPAAGDKEAALAVAWSPELTRQEIRRGLPPIPAVPIAHDPRRPTTFYPLHHADGDQVVALLRSLFIVVDQAHPYATFESEEAQPVDSLIVAASPEHQAEIARVLALVDPPENPPARAGEGSAPEPLVVAYPIRHADGDAAAGVLRSLFLVVNHQVAYARFGYDARTRSLIAIASREHQKQIAKVVEVLDVQPADKDGAQESGGEQPVRVYPVRHAGGEQLVSKLRSQFVVVNHEKAEARFAFDARTGRLIVIAAEKLQAKVSAAIAALDGPPG